MKRLLLITFLLNGINQLSLAQSCKDAVNTLRSKIEANPDSVLYALGDAMTLQPNCMSDFIETAIIAAKPSPDTLTQIIRLAVTQYPDEVGTIAEAAVLASPENVDVIRKAFQPQVKPIIATPVLEDELEPSPIENFIAKDAPIQAHPVPAVPIPVDLDYTSLQQPISTPPLEFKTSQYDPQDVAEKAMRTIDELLTKLKHPEAGKSETPIAVEPTENLLGESQKIETFRLNLTDDKVAITTLDDAGHQDQNDEIVTAPSVDPIVIKDSLSEKPMVSLLNPIVKEKKTPEVTPDKIEFTSSVYHIPSSADLLNGQHSVVAPTVIRSVSASPTTPRGR